MAMLLKKLPYIGLLFSISFLVPAAQIKTPLRIHSIAVSPYAMKVDNVESGIYYDLAERLISKVGVRAEHLIVPYARIVQEMKSGQPIVTIMYKYEQLAPYVDYIYPLPTLRNVVIGVQGKSFAKETSLAGKNIAYLRGAKFSAEIDNNQAIKKHIVTDFEQGIAMLAANRVDAIIGPMQPIMAAAQKLGLDDNFFGKPLVVSQRTPWLQVAKNTLTEEEKKTLQDAFITMMSDGDYEKIRNKYQ